MSKKKASSTAEPEQHAFQAETRQLLDIVIHSLYSNKEIFLRELISNASDALDRLRLEALTEEGLLGEGEKLEIRLETDKDAHTLTISDNGTGMRREEVIENIGTIAKSGSRELMRRLEEAEGSAKQAAELIGQFGVGFYSAFMVADKVTLTTRRQGEEKAVIWESSGDGQYSLSEGHRFARGTTITLHLKPVDTDAGLEDFTDPWVVKRIVKRYSDFVAYPVILKEEIQEEEKDESGKPIPGKTRTVVEEKTLNSQKPLWTRPESEVTDEEYAELYKHISHDWNEPLDRLSLHAEGRIEYTALLFIPSKAPFDMFQREQRWGLQLYVRRVLIMDHCEDLLPTWLRFIKGVVDSSDLDLNVSRELVQQDRQIRQMHRWLARKVLDHLQAMRNTDEEKYLELWKNYGPVLKEGVRRDEDLKDRLVELLYFQSSADADKLTTLAAYVERMKEGQEEIYYLTGDSRRTIENSPHLEAFRAKGYEVLYLTDPVDEWMVETLTEYQEKKLHSASKGDVELGSEEEREAQKKDLEEKQETYKDLLERLAKDLEEEVKEVRLSSRLTDSPACLVGGQWDMSPHMERMMRQMDGGGMPRQKRILEINPAHPILAKLQERFGADAEDAKLGDFAQLLLGYALLAEGSELPDPARYNRLVSELMVAAL